MLYKTKKSIFFNSTVHSAGEAEVSQGNLNTDPKQIFIQTFFVSLKCMFWAWGQLLLFTINFPEKAKVKIR